MRTLPPTPQPVVRHWSTDEVKTSERLDYWVGAICEAFLQMDCSSRQAEQFEGHLHHLPLRQVALNQLQASTQDVYRTSSCITRATDSPYYLITQTTAAWQVRQGGREWDLRAGDVALVDAAHPYEFHFPQGVDCLSVQLPRSWLKQWLQHITPGQTHWIRHEHGWGAQLSSLCLQLAKQPALALQMPAATMEEHLGAMLMAALELQAFDQPVASDVYSRAKAWMQDRMGDTSPWHAADLALALNVSLRSLHRCFAQRGDSILGCWRRLRIDAACQLMRQARWAHLSLAAIAARCGYGDPSHFGRDFLRLMGQSPARWRAGQSHD